MIRVTYPDRLQLTLIVQLAYPDNPGHPWASCAGREQGCHKCGVISFCRNLFSRGESNSCVPRLPRCSVDIRGRSWIEHPLIQNIVRLSSIEDNICPTCKHNLRVIFSECDRCRDTLTVNNPNTSILFQTELRRDRSQKKISPN